MSKKNVVQNVKVLLENTAKPNANYSLGKAGKIFAFKNTFAMPAVMCGLPKKASVCLR
jgi:hypothetical protein